MARPQRFTAAHLSAWLAAEQARLPSLTRPMASALRSVARRRCKAFGVPVPGWAAYCKPAPRRPGWAPADTHECAQFATARRKRVSVDIPCALRLWRSKHPGSVVRVHRGGVELHELGAPVRHFPSVAEAVAAI